MVGRGNDEDAIKAQTQQFDVVVIGGGSGLIAAYYALQDGKRVVLISDRPNAIGGTCINFGCIPTKTIIQSARVVDTIRTAADFGIHVDQSTLRGGFPPDYAGHARGPGTGRKRRQTMG